VKRAIGAVVLGLSACGYPLTEFVICRWGRRGAVVSECVCAGLAIRDAAMVASGVPGRLRPVPAALLRLELAVGVVASLAGLRPLPADRTTLADRVRRAAVATLFALHTIRFGIYLRPDQGRRATPGKNGEGRGAPAGEAGLFIDRTFGNM